MVADDVLLDLPLIFCRAFARLAMCLLLIDEKPTLGTGLHSEKKKGKDMLPGGKWNTDGDE